MDKSEIRITERDTYTNNTDSYAPKILEKISIWQILIFKVILLAVLMYVFFMPLFPGN